MKKMLLALLILVAVVTPAYVVNRHTRVVVKQVPVSITKRVMVVPPQYRVGDTQSGVTFEQLFAPAHPLTSMDEVDPGSYYLVAVKLSVPAEDARPTTLLYTSDEQYLKPLGGNVRECGDCLVFIVPKGVYVDTLVYKDLKWYL